MEAEDSELRFSETRAGPVSFRETILELQTLPFIARVVCHRGPPRKTNELSPLSQSENPPFQTPRIFRESLSPASVRPAVPLPGLHVSFPSPVSEARFELLWFPSSGRAKPCICNTYTNGGWPRNAKALIEAVLARTRAAARHRAGNARSSPNAAASYRASRSRNRGAGSAEAKDQSPCWP